jgi:hypothetical protein
VNLDSGPRFSDSVNDSVNSKELAISGFPDKALVADGENCVLKPRIQEQSAINSTVKSNFFKVNRYDQLVIRDFDDIMVQESQRSKGLSAYSKTVRVIRVLDCCNSVCGHFCIVNLHNLEGFLYNAMVITKDCK